MDNPFSHLMLIQPAVTFGVLAVFLIWESRLPFFRFFESIRARSVHFAENIVMGTLGAILTGLVFVSLWIVSAEGSARSEFGLLYQKDLPLWAHVVLAVVLLDIWTYGWHRANHQIAFLWRFHRMHHSDPCMDVSTAFRFHPGEIMMSSVLRIPLLFLLGIQVWELALYELLMGIVVALHHANIGLGEPIDRLVRIVFATPAMHKVHHSQIQVETDSNYSSLLSVWDRVFGSFRIRADPASIKIGLAGWSAARYQTVLGLLKTPLLRSPEVDEAVF
jgi:sterol desaturase/sphingolipid hydroxylase (fatty acid hydroxylase superfamily)